MTAPSAALATTVAPGRRPPPALTERPYALGTLTARRLQLSLRNPRAILLPLATPVLIAVVMAPALAKAAGHINGIGYMTYVAVG
jgi:hypothetical protein